MRDLKIMSLGLLVVVFSIVSLVTGCAKPVRGSGNDKQAGEGTSLVTSINPEALKNPGEFLQLRLITAAKIDDANQDGPYPDRAITPETPRPFEAAISKGDSIAFKNTIQLTGAPIFLTFSENGFGLPIRSVDLTHSRRNALNQQEGPDQRVEVHYDEVSRRWYVSMATLLGDDLSTVGANELQIARLDSKTSLYVSFRAIGPVKMIQHQYKKWSNPAQAFPSPGAYVQALDKIFVLGQDELSNPTARPLKLWVRAHSGSRLALKTSLAYGRFVERASEPPAGPYYDQHVSEGYFEPTKVIVRQKGSAAQSEFSVVNGWAGIDLLPYEVIQLQWVGESKAICSLPAATNRILNWTTGYQHRCPPRSEACEPGWRSTPHSQTVTESWGVIGASLNGLFGREIRIADPDLDKSLATSELIPPQVSSLVRLIANSADLTSETIGTALSHGTSPAVCQGVGWN